MKSDRSCRDSRLSRSSKHTASISPDACSAQMSSEPADVGLYMVGDSISKCRVVSRYLATCSADTTVKIWSISPNYEFKLEKILQGHQRWVWDCAFSADSAYLVTGELYRHLFIVVATGAAHRWQRLPITLPDSGRWPLARPCGNTMGTTKVVGSASSSRAWTNVS